MKNTNLFPKIVKVTDLRYRWPEVLKELEEGEWPVLVIEHSTPKAVIFSLGEAKKLLGGGRLSLTREDPLDGWRKRHARQFSDWDATAVIRKVRDSRWNLS